MPVCLGLNMFIVQKLQLFLTQFCYQGAKTIFQNVGFFSDLMTTFGLEGDFIKCKSNLDPEHC